MIFLDSDGLLVYTPAIMFPGSSKKKMGGASIAFPDVCKTPAPPAPFVPIPYPNIQACSTNFKVASKKILKFAPKFKSSSGDEPGTPKGITKSVNKISTLFTMHSSNVKVMGKQVTKLMLPTQANKAFKQAEKQQKTFEMKIKKECDKLLKECAGDKELEKTAKELVEAVGKAARGHPV